MNVGSSRHAASYNSSTGIYELNGLTGWTSGQTYQVSIARVVDYDTDDDNLIEIANLAQLNAVRWDVDGNGVPDGGSYAAAFPNAVTNMGCAATCLGYELTADLDFDTDGSGTANAADTYWRGGLGWGPIGTLTDPYTGVFHGNGHTISNLFINRVTAQVGLFGVLGGTGFVHHVGLMNVNVTSTMHDVGALVGFMQGANTRVAASYAGSGSVSGAGQTGGLVGSAQGQVAASWTNVAVAGTTQVGGLVGNNNGGVKNAYARGTVSGTGSLVHGAVGATVGGAALVDVYYNSDIHLVFDSTYSRTTAELQGGDSYAGIYATWNVDVDGVSGVDDPWDFGSGKEYPALKTDRNDDGTFTWQEFGLQGREATDSDRPQTTDYDTDDDNLIEVSTLAQLDAMRYDLDGNGSVQAYTKLAAETVQLTRAQAVAKYVAAFPDSDIGGNDRMGCPATCLGYELTADLDFDTDGSGTANAADAPGIYDSDNSGWSPIHSNDSCYTATFEGNYHSISHLFINESDRIGLFGHFAGGEIRNVGLLDVNITATGTDNGTLVAYNGTCEFLPAMPNVPPGTVTNSYATGSLTCTASQCGGLVGSNTGTVQTSWANVAVTNTGNNNGGLVGHNTGSITASYSIGSVTAAEASTGGLVGGGAGTVTNSYFNTQTTAQTAGSQGKTTAQLQNPTGYGGIDANWNLDLDGDGTADTPWHFGTSSQYPTHSGLLSIPDAPGTPAPPTFGTPTTTSLAVMWTAPTTGGSPITGYDLQYRQAEATDWTAGPQDVTGTSATIIGLTADTVYHVQVRATNATGDSEWSAYGTGRTGAVIEITNLAQLNALRWDLDGNGTASTGNEDAYAAAFPPNATPCAAISACAGYELATDLDFDTNNDGMTNAAGDDYWNAGAGWEPISGWTTTFNGNGHTISNLFINRSSNQTGLFGQTTGGDAHIRNIGLIDVNVTGGGNDTGALVGFMQGAGTVTRSYATGSVTGQNQTGGLVGSNQGTIRASYAHVAVNSTGNNNGGLAGHNGGSVIASYATGAVTATAASTGGPVGASTGTITNSYFNVQTTTQTDASQGKTTAELQNPIAYSGIYAAWDVDLDNADSDNDLATGGDAPRDFGTSGDYPALKVDRDGDGTATWLEFGDQGRDTVYLGTMTVGNQGADTRGYDEDGPFGALDPNTFIASSGTQYTIKLLYHTRDTVGSDQFSSLAMQFEPATLDREYALYVGDQTHILSAAAQIDGAEYALDIPSDFRWEVNQQVVAALAPAPVDYDTDNDNLIEITNLARLDAMRWDSAGNGAASAGNEAAYAAGFPSPVGGMGCPATCIGYELTADLDFDTDGSDAANDADDYWNDTWGWDPIEGYTAEFNGNGHGIYNLFMDRSDYNTALFGATDGAFIHHLGLIDVNVSQRGIMAHRRAAPLVGTATGGGQVFGLVGSTSGNLFAAWSNVEVLSLEVEDDVNSATGLAGLQAGAHARAGYAAGSVRGGTNHAGALLFGDQILTINQVYYDANRAGTVNQDQELAQTTVELQSPTGYTGIYAQWNVDLDGDGTTDDPWDFGSSADYPALKADRNNDGIFTVAEFPGQHVRTPQDYDADDDNLIDVNSLSRLDALRWDPDGDGAVAADDQANYTAAFANRVAGMGCPGTCAGYELTADLDFNSNGDGAVDAKDLYWNGGAGWDPIGPETGGAYAAEFSGDGRRIINLFISRSSGNAGLFGALANGAYVHHLGLVDVDVTATAGVTGQKAGALAGAADAARIAAVYATGAVTGYQLAGGLVGDLTNGGVIAASWADVAVSSTRGPGPGGLAGHAQENAIIRAAYAIGTAAQTNSGTGWGTATLSTNAALNDTYFNSDTGGTLVDAHLGKTTAELQTPTGYAGIYANWNVDLDGDGTVDAPWDFGTSGQYPALKFDRDGDGTATVEEFPLQPVRTILVDYDSDSDNLIEITTVAQLDAIRWDLDGIVSGSGSLRSSHVAAFIHAIEDESTGGLRCAAACRGYELKADLDFDTNGDGRMDIAGDDYWNGGKGWQPIGTDDDGYQAVFNGNGHTISNLYMNRRTFDTPLDYFHGLFRKTEGGARISYVGLVNVKVTGFRWVGALVGRMDSSNDVIAASYVTGRVRAATGEPDGVGGLVGETYGKVIASWARVNMSANGDSTGGLVGLLDRFGTGGLRLTASYALGDVAAGGNPDDKAVGGLVGWLGGNTQIADSYFNTETIVSVLSHGRVLRDRTARGKTTNQLQRPTGYTGIYANWDVDVNGDGTADDPWDFGTSGDYPRLKADRNGDGVFTAAEFGRLAGVAAVAPGVTRGGTAQFRVTVKPAPAADLNVNLSTTPYGQAAAFHTVTVPEGQPTAVLRVTTTSSTAVGALRATVAAGQGYAAVGQAVVYVSGPGDYDTDDDGLIEVSNLAQLDAIRYDLNGDGLPANDNGAYADAFPNAAPGMGCAPCRGYELAKNLDFDTNGSGEADASDTYWNGGDGWLPIGTKAEPYAAEFHGNGHTISNLYINRPDASNMGLFGGLAADAEVHHLGLYNADVTGGYRAGALTALNAGIIHAVYTTRAGLR